MRSLNLPQPLAIVSGFACFARLNTIVLHSSAGERACHSVNCMQNRLQKGHLHLKTALNTVLRIRKRSYLDDFWGTEFDADVELAWQALLLF